MLTEEKMKKKIGKLIWGFSEYWDIDLGEFAPIVFGWMIGSKGYKITDRRGENESEKN